MNNKTFKEILDNLVEGIVEAYKNCPNSEHKTFEEVADWAGKHVLITEKKDDNI